MAESDKSRYNERFSFANLTGEMSASRSTRYRSKKKRKLDTFPEGQVERSNIKIPIVLVVITLRSNHNSKTPIMVLVNASLVMILR